MLVSVSLKDVRFKNKHSPVKSKFGRKLDILVTDDFLI